MYLNLPDDVKHILSALNAHGYEAYAVGGCVRDSLMGIAPKDWDIATSALPDQVKKIFSHTFDTGIQHGTVTVVLNHINYEVTTYRIDGTYLDNRRPSSVTFTRSLPDDLSRRDFTMNAIAYHPSVGFEDPFNGRADIRLKIIRCVGCPDSRFTEDALRMLRAVRFAGQLGFDIEPNTFSAIKPLSERLASISAERIREELNKLLLSPYPSAIILLKTSGLLAYLLRHRKFDGDLSAITAQINTCPRQTAMVFALFFVWAGDNASALMKDLRFDNKTLRETVAYIRWMPRPIAKERFAVKQVLRQLPPLWLENLLILKTITIPDGLNKSDYEAVRVILNDILQKGECYSLQALAINGNDLITAGITEGRAIKNTLEALLEEVMQNPSLNEREYLLKRARLV